MRLIAITGSIGCGKSTLAGLLRQQGYLVYNVDGWTKNLYRKKFFNELILKNFPDVNNLGSVDKKKLRNIVFNDIKRLRKLESLIHPLLKQKLRKVIHKNAKFDRIVFIDAALIFELGWNKYCDLIIVADVDKDIQKQRVMKRDGITADDFAKILDIQMNNKDKISRGDIVINTNKSLKKLNVELLNLMSGING